MQLLSEAFYESNAANYFGEGKHEVDLNHANLHMAPTNCESHRTQATLLETQAQFAF